MKKNTFNSNYRQVLRGRGYLRKLRYPMILILVVGTSFLMLHNSNKEPILKEAQEENTLAIYLEDEQINNIPEKDSGYTLDLSKSCCNHGVEISFDYNTWSVKTSFQNYTNTDNTRVKCSLYFKWNKATLTVNPNGGSWNGTTNVSNFEKLIGTLDVIQEPTRDGYEFRGWEITGGTSFYNYGTSLYTDENFQNGLNNIRTYNNLENNNVTLERVPSSSDSPIKDSNYMLKITTTGEANPFLGGFYQSTPSKILGTFYHVIVAKIPVGYTITEHRNPIGLNSQSTWLTSQEGTGEFETYIYKSDCGTSGSFSTFGHVALYGTLATSSEPVTWYVAYSTILDASAGTPLYTDTTFSTSMNNMLVYNNLENGNVILNRINRTSDNPLLDSNYMIEIQNIGYVEPDLGGFYQSTNSRAKGVYYHLIYANIPKGYSLRIHSNIIGTDSSQLWLTTNEGTGKWEKYIYRTIAGISGEFSTFGHLSLATGTMGTLENPVTWYVGYANMFDATDLEGNFSTYVYEYQNDSVITAKWISST